MNIDMSLNLVKEAGKDIIITKNNIDVSQSVVVYVNGVGQYIMTSSEVNGNKVDVTNLDITINDELSVMYTGI